MSETLIDDSSSQASDPVDPANVFPSSSLRLSPMHVGCVNEPPRKLSIEELPYLPLMKIFSNLTICEKLRTDFVSKRWQGFVTDSLQLETVFHVGSSVKPRDVDAVFRRMCDPRSGTTNIRLMELAWYMCPSNDIASCFPRLKSLRLNLDDQICLPVFVFQSKNLTKLSCSGLISEEEFTLLCSECPMLKEIDVEVENPGMNPEMPGQFEDFREDFLAGAKCTPDEISINLLREKGNEKLVEAFPDLKVLKIRNVDGPVRPKYFRPFKDLCLSELSIDLTGGYLKYDDIESVLQHIFFFSGTSTIITTSLKILHVVWTFGPLLSIDSAANCRVLEALHITQKSDTNFAFGQETHSMSSLSAAPFTPDLFPSLETLTLPCPDFAVRDSSVFNLPCLKRLRVCGCKGYGRDIALFLTKIDITCPSLEYVHLDNFILDHRSEESEVNKFFCRLKEIQRPWKLVLNRCCKANSIFDCTPAYPPYTCASYFPYLVTRAQSVGLSLIISPSQDICCCGANAIPSV